MQEPTMKYALILPDGAADEPVEQLGGRTPLEAARTPNIDSLAATGRVGRVVTVPDGFSPGSDVATMSLFGYDPRVDHTGRAPLEAAAQGIPVPPGQTIFRCNLVTIAEGLMADFTAGHISSTEGASLIDALNGAMGNNDCRFHRGVSYRNLLVARLPSGADLKTVPPHDIPDRPIRSHLPRGRGSEFVRQIMDQAEAVLRTHEVNAVRRDMGENPATNIWLWGQGLPGRLQPFRERFGVSAVTIAAVDLIRGIARSAGIDVLNVPGATGYLDTDYAAKGRAAIDALNHNDLVIVHIEAPDEAGHQGDAAAKVQSLERIDEHIVGPLLESLRTRGSWRMLIAPDHPTPVNTRIHSSVPPPFCLGGSDIRSVRPIEFSEAASMNSEWIINPGFELMAFFLKPSAG